MGRLVDILFVLVLLLTIAIYTAALVLVLVFYVVPSSLMSERRYDAALGLVHNLMPELPKFFEETDEHKAHNL